MDGWNAANRLVGSALGTVRQRVRHLDEANPRDGVGQE